VVCSSAGVLGIVGGETMMRDCASRVSSSALVDISPSGSHTYRMSQPVPEPNPPSPPESAEDPWRVAFDEFKKRDEKMVKDYQEEIDTLLVFVRRPHHLLILKLITSIS
jgi:hypothetical protein